MSQRTRKTHARPRRKAGVDHSACLVLIHPPGPLLGRRFPLPGNGLTLGRENADVCIDDTSISRRHTRIEAHGDSHIVSDLASTNGTFVNDQPVEHPVPLEDGDYLRIGNCILRFLAGSNIEAEYHEEIHRLAMLDALTQIHNRRHLAEFLETELARTERHKRPLSLLMFDIDRFKSINDGFGHLCGDFVLRGLAARIRGSLRTGDVFARYGGEEFALVLVETPIDRAVETAERIRTLVKSEPFVFEDYSHNLTISIGVSTAVGDPPTTPPELIEAADRRLYRAKQTGRNRVVAHDEEAT